MFAEWQNIDFNTIVGGVASDGVLNLQHFLNDYKKEFSVKTVNPSCKKCLKNYHDQFIKKYQVMNSDCNYRLRKKREGIVVPFSNGLRVNNNTLTNELAEKLLQKYEASYVFDVYPKTELKQETKEEDKPIYINKKKRKRNN